VLNNNIKVYFGRVGLVAVVGLILVSCAHQSKVTPSTGHIDGKADTQNAPQDNTAAAPIPKLVRSSPQLPPPKVTTKAQTYSVVVNEVPVKEILFALARESKINIDIHPAIRGRATLNAVDQTLPAILERLAKQVDLTYRMDGNVLHITPDQPVLRTYKVDYVNINRDTEGFIGADGQISSSAQTSGGTGSSTTTSGNGANNSSRTLVSSKAKNHLWESLIQNIKDLLAETDKEVIVTRFGTLGEKDAKTEKSSSDENKAQVDNNKAEADQRKEQRSEYKTLFAANVIANPETGVISVRATNKQHEKVQEFIDKVLHDARKQVLVEATIVEVVLKDSFQAGIDWSRLNNSDKNSGFVFGQRLGSKNFNINNNVIQSTENSNALGIGTDAGIVFGYLNTASRIGNIAASINLLKQFGDTKVLSSPKLMVLNNQTAVLKVVDNLVYFTVQAQQATVGGTVGGTLATFTTTPNTVPVGIVMSVTPQINDTGSVGINVRPSITRVIDSVQDPNPNLRTGQFNTGTPIKSEIPIIQVREMESMLQINSGSTAVLGGLMQDEIVRNTDKVPGLSNVPGVGSLFKGKNDATRKTELVIFLRPTVISNASLESDELQSYKKYLPAQQLQNVLEEAN